MIDPVTVVVGALIRCLTSVFDGVFQEAGRDAYRFLKAQILGHRPSPQPAGRQPAMARDEAAQLRSLEATFDALERDPKNPAIQQDLHRVLTQAGIGTDEQLVALSNQLLAILTDPTVVAAKAGQGPQQTAGITTLGTVLDQHVATVLDTRSRYRVSDTDLTAKAVSTKEQVHIIRRVDISRLHHRIRTVIGQIAVTIQHQATQETAALIGQIQSLQDRDRADRLLRGDRELRVSYETLRLTVEYYGALNELALKKVEAASGPQAELNMVFGNAILMFELTDYVIDYIQNFAIGGIRELSALRNEVEARVVKAKADQARLAASAQRPEVEAAVREGILSEIRNRDAAIDAVRREWDEYLADTGQFLAQVDAVKGKIPTLEVIREHARIQISVLELIAMLRLLRQTFTAARATVESLQAFRLAPLTTTRVRRLLSI